MNNLKLLDIYYGGQCNLTCFQCDTRSDSFRKGEFDPSLETIKQGIDLARKKFYIRNFSLLGGEPLLNLKRVTDIIQYIRSIDKECIITLPTNGSLLYRYIEEMYSLIVNYNIVLSVTNHYAAFDNNETEKIKNSVDQLVRKTKLDQRNSDDYYLEVFDYNNPSDEWQDRLKKFGTNSFSSPEDAFWGHQKQGIFYHEQVNFQQHYIIKNGLVKPHAENNPDSSYSNGCCSPFCTFLYDKKLYKCAALGTLDKFLIHHGQENDPDWQKYLSYTPLDLENSTDQEVINFSQTKYHSINECDMCSSVGRSYIKTKETTLPKYKKYVPITRVE